MESILVSDEAAIVYASVLVGVVVCFAAWKIGERVVKANAQRRWEQEKVEARDAALPEPYQKHAVIPHSGGSYAVVVRTFSPRDVVGSVWPRATGFTAVVGRDVSDGYYLDQAGGSRHVVTHGTFGSIEEAAIALAERDHWRSVEIQETRAAEESNRERIRGYGPTRADGR